MVNERRVNDVEKNTCDQQGQSDPGNREGKVAKEESRAGGKVGAKGNSHD